MIYIFIVGNIVDLSRRSYTYEDRLNKYRKRDFTVGIPGMELPPTHPTKKYFSEMLSNVDLYSLKKLGKTTKLTGFPRIFLPDIQQNERSNVYVSERYGKQIPASDYGAPYLNNYSIEKLHEKKLTEITLKDGSKISLFTYDNFGSNKNIVNTLWITENPGKSYVTKGNALQE